MLATAPRLVEPSSRTGVDFAVLPFGDAARSHWADDAGALLRHLRRSRAVEASRRVNRASAVAAARA